VTLRVLVVEDDEDWREIIRKQFHSRGCTVTTAVSLDAAEQALQGETFAIVTLDRWLSSGAAPVSTTILNAPSIKASLV